MYAGFKKSLLRLVVATSLLPSMNDEILYNNNNKMWSSQRFRKVQDWFFLSNKLSPKMLKTTSSTC